MARRLGKDFSIEKQYLEINAYKGTIIIIINKNRKRHQRCSFTSFKTLYKRGEWVTMKEKKEWELALCWKKQRESKTREWVSREKKEKKERVELAELFSRDTLISSLSNIKIDSEILYEIKPLLHLFIASYII